MSSFLPAYFSYLADCFFKGVSSNSFFQFSIPLESFEHSTNSQTGRAQQPTVLAKIFGIYRISFGKKYKNLDFLVMEVKLLTSLGFWMAPQIFN